MAEELDDSKTDDDLFIEFFGYEPPAYLESGAKGLTEQFADPTIFSPGQERILPHATPAERQSRYVDMVEQRLTSEMENKSYEVAKRIAEREVQEAIQAAAGGYEESVHKVPIEEREGFRRGLTGAAGRAFSRQVYDISDQDLRPHSEKLIESQRKKTVEFDQILEENGFLGTFAKAWDGAEPVSQEEAKEMGIGLQTQEFWGRDKKEGVDPDVGFLDDPYIPYGIKSIPDLAERAVIKLGIENMFAPLLLEDDEQEAYIRETRASIPTANFEQIIEVVELGHDKGMTDEDIKAQFRQEIGRLLQSHSYDDLPSRFQMNAPSVKQFKKELKSNPNQFDMRNKLMVQAIESVEGGKSDKEVQEKLNFVVLGSLPDSILAGTVPSTVDLVDEAVKAANRAIASKGDPGEAARVLQQAMGTWTFTEERIGDEIVVVESTWGKLLRMLSLFTEGVAEIDATMGLTQEDVKEKLRDLGLPEELSHLPASGLLNPLMLTPASRDFYYNLGIRDPDSSHLARFFANVESGNAGFTVHFTNEARARGYKRGTPEYHAFSLYGSILDFFVPWEKYHIQAVTTPTKAAWRGGRMVKAFNVDGFRGRAALSGASPFWYNHLYNVAEKATIAMDGLKNKIGETPSLQSIRAVIDEDNAVQQAIKAGIDEPLDESGNKIKPLTLDERTFASQIMKKMEKGSSFEDAFDSVKREYKPGLAETTADAASAIVEHVLHTEEAKLFQRTADDGGILPFEFDQQTKQVLQAAGFNAAEVYDIVFKRGTENANRYLEALKIISHTGDQQTITMRNTPQYVKVKKDLSKLVDDGDLTEGEMFTFLSVLETRAINEAAGSTAKSIVEPEDFFGAVKIKRKKTKNADGTAGPEKIRIDVGNLMSVDRKNIASFVSMFQKSDFMRLLDNDAEMLIDLMGKTFVNEFLKDIDTVENVGRSRKMTKYKPTKVVGVQHIELLLRQVIDGSGTSGLQASQANQIYANLASVYARMRGPAVGFIDELQRPILDALLKPDRFWRTALVELNRFADQIDMSGKFAKISADPIEQIMEGKGATVGRKRIFADIDIEPTYVKQAMGIKEGMTEMDAITAFSRAIGYTVGQWMMKQESRSAIAGMDLVRISDASYADKRIVDSILKRVNARMATTLGIKKDSLLSSSTYMDGKQLKGMFVAPKKGADKTDFGYLKLSSQQAANMKVLLRRMSSEPFIGKKIPQNLMVADADLTKVPLVDYQRVVELMTDLEAGGYARRSIYTEQIPRSLGYSILGAVKSEVLSYSKISNVVDEYINPVLNKFVLKDSLKNVRPEYRAKLERGLAKMGRSKPTILKVFRETRKEIKKGNHAKAISLIFDRLRGVIRFEIDPKLVDILVGTTEDGVTGNTSKAGIVSFLDDFTANEINHIKQLEKTMIDEGLESLDFKSEADFYGQESIVADKYTFSSLTPEQMKTLFDLPIAPKHTTNFVSDPIPKLTFLTKNSTQQLLYKLVERFNEGFNGISPEVNTALSVLQRHSTDSGMNLKAIQEMDHITRIEIASAVQTIKKQLQKNQRHVVESGNVILESMGGKHLGLQEDSAQNAATAYRLFSEGADGWRQLHQLVRIGPGEAFDLSRPADYSPVVAYLEMISRLMARQEVMGLYDDLIKAGMPGIDEAVYKSERSTISLSGEKYSIETNEKFYDRVKSYMDMIFRESRDIRQRVESLDPNEAPTILQPKQPRATEDFQYGFAAFEPTGTTRFRGADAPGDFMDIRAEIAAEEVLARFGHRTRGGSAKSEGSYVNHVFPDGSEAFIPQPMSDAITEALERAAPIGSAKGGSAARALSYARVGDPYLTAEFEAKHAELMSDPENPAYARRARSTSVKRTMGAAVDVLKASFPVSINHIKRGVTTGFILPNPGYYVANFLGGAMQLATGVSPVQSIRVLSRNPKMVGAVVARMWGEGTWKPFGDVLIVTKSGSIHTADQLADMAVLARLKSSFIQAETQRGLADNVEKYIRKNDNVLTKTGDLINSVNDFWSETATAIDNFYRVSVFVDEIMEGASPAAAASLARKVAFDYSALTDFEKDVMRNVIIFYSYLKKNSELFFDTLVTKPWNITNQLRLSKGLQQANLSNNPEVVVNEYLRDRYAIFFSETFRNQVYAGDKMTVAPQTPINDVLAILMDMYEGAHGDEQAQRMLLGKVAPWVQAPFVIATDFDIFYGQPLGDFNEIPPWLVEWDLAVTGGMLYDLFDITERHKRNPKSRMVEGDEFRPYYHAGNGKAWWIFRNLIQIPGAGRSMSWMTQLDRSDMYMMEAITEGLRSARLSAEEYGLVSEREREFKEGDLMSPRVGMTRWEELGGAFNIRTQIVDTELKVRDNHFNNMKYQNKKEKQNQNAYREALKKLNIKE